MVINKLLTTVNYQKASNRKINYIVVHYVGAEGGAEANCKYFNSVYRESSAHYFVGHQGEVWQCVEDKDIAWHCGAKTYKHSYCRNDNSIGIEMCCRKNANGWYFEDATVAATIELIKELMSKYNIAAENVIRHYDVVNKHCPEPYVRDASAWSTFKSKLTIPVVKKTVDEVAKEVISGKWGNGTERKNRLVAAGYSYDAVQTRVNELLGKKTDALKVGDKVKLISGAVYYNGAQIPSWVFKKVLYVREIKGDRVVISTLASGAVTGAVNSKHLKAV